VPTNAQENDQRDVEPGPAFDDVRLRSRHVGAVRGIRRVARRDPATRAVALEEVQAAAARVLGEEDTGTAVRVDVGERRRAAVLVQPEGCARLPVAVVQADGAAPWR
jgi:hypothetical protein